MTRLRSCWYNTHAAMAHPQCSLGSIEWPDCPLNCCGLTQKRLQLWHHSALRHQGMRKRLSCLVGIDVGLGSAGVASLTAQPLICTSPLRAGQSSSSLERRTGGFGPTIVWMSAVSVTSVTLSSDLYSCRFFPTLIFLTIEACRVSF